MLARNLPHSFHIVQINFQHSRTEGESVNTSVMGDHEICLQLCKSRKFFLRYDAAYYEAPAVNNARDVQMFMKAHLATP